MTKLLTILIISLATIIGGAFLYHYADCCSKTSTSGGVVSDAGKKLNGKKKVTKGKSYDGKEVSLDVGPEKDMERDNKTESSYIDSVSEYCCGENWLTGAAATIIGGVASLSVFYCWCCRSTDPTPPGPPGVASEEWMKNGYFHPALGVVKAFYFPDEEKPWDKDHTRWIKVWGCARNASGKSTAATFTNSEAAYQALKFWHNEDTAGNATTWTTEFTTKTGNEAFKLKKSLAGNEDFTYGGSGNGWQGMFRVLISKYMGDTKVPEFSDGDISFPKRMAKMLQNTGESYLVEHNEVFGRDKIWSDNAGNEKNGKHCVADANKNPKTWAGAKNSHGANATTKDAGDNWLGLQQMLIRDILNGNLKFNSSYTMESPEWKAIMGQKVPVKVDGKVDTVIVDPYWQNMFDLNNVEPNSWSYMILKEWGLNMANGKFTDNTWWLDTVAKAATVTVLGRINDESSKKLFLLNSPQFPFRKELVENYYHKNAATGKYSVNLNQLQVKNHVNKMPNTMEADYKKFISMKAGPHVA